MPRSTPPPASGAHLDAGHAVEAEAAPSAFGRQRLPLGSRAADLVGENSFLSRRLVTQDVREGLAISAVEAEGDLLAIADRLPDDAIDRARRLARRRAARATRSG